MVRWENPRSQAETFDYQALGAGIFSLVVENAAQIEDVRGDGSVVGRETPPDSQCLLEERFSRLVET